MKALVKTQHGEQSLAYMDVAEPVTRPDEIKVKVHACGICGTDLHIMHDEYASFPPVVMGHEYSGIVAEVGEEVSDFKPGDRVVSLTSAITCENCEYCFSGHRMMCPERRSLGSGVNGGFGEYLTVPARLAFHLPDNVSLDAAALCEPLACVVRGVIERTTVKGGDLVFVSGAGIIGQFAAQVAGACGGIVVMAGMDVDAERLKLAKDLGAHATVNVQRTKPEDLVAEYTGGRGFDVAFECAGAAPSAATCLNVLRKMGRFTQLGLYGKPVPFDCDLALYKELTLSNSFASERTSWERTLRLLEYQLINVEPLVGSRFTLDNWREAFARVEDKQDFKVLLMP